MSNKKVPEPLRKALQRYLAWMGISRHIVRRIIADIHRWIVNNGVHYACTQLKRVGQTLRAWIRRQQCKHDIPTPTWVATTRSGFPKFFLGVDRRDWITLEKLTSLYKVFKPDQFKSVGALPDEVAKRVKAVVTPCNAGRDAMNEACRLIKVGCSSRIRINGASVGHIITKQTKSLADPLAYYAAIKSIVPSDVCVDEAFGSDTMPFPTSQVLGYGLVDVSTSVTAGRYELAVEDGFKARNYFNFHPVLQALTWPLYQGLESLERSSNYSVRYLPLFDKIRTCQQWLSEGRIVHSIDQSSATDRFPFALQMFYLHSVGCPKEWMRFLHKISLMCYDVDKPLQESVGSKFVRIACGQPMGAGYSMPLYTNTLIAMILGACSEFGFEPLFQVLGDDIIIADEGLSQWFVSFLPTLGVEISSTKGVASDCVAEFIGATITASGYTFPGKFKYPDKRNIFQIVKQFGRPLRWGKDDESDLRFQRAVGLALIKEQCYKPLGQVRGCGPIPPLAVRIDAGMSDRISKIEAEYHCDASTVDENYLNYTQSRVIGTLQSLGGQFIKGTVKTIGTYTDDLLGRLVSDTEFINHFKGTEWEEDTHWNISLLCDAMLNVVSYAVNAEVGKAFKSWCKPSGPTRDIKLGSFLRNMGEWLLEWSGKPCRSYDRTAAYFVFEGISAILDEIRGYTVMDKHTNKWRASQARYERFVQYVHANPQ